MYVNNGCILRGLNGTICCKTINGHLRVSYIPIQLWINQVVSLISYLDT